MTEQLTFNLMPDRRTFTVSELTGKIRDLLAKNFTDIAVQGEVSNCREAQSGHIYFTLKDDRSQVRCVYFKQQQRGIKFRPEDGLQVTVRGSISVYEQRGEYQIYVEKIELMGQGALQLALKPRVCSMPCARNRCRFSPAASASSHHPRALRSATSSASLRAAFRMCI
jgi:aspartyl/asparaginyl-tRNA synthetase